MLTIGDSPVPASPARRAAVLGSPVAHSLSPVLHRAAYDALGLRGWTYDAVAVGGVGEPTLAAFLPTLDERWVGLSLTMPNKETGLAAADAVSERAAVVGAANTLVRTAGGWSADSTDAWGLEAALREAGVGHVDAALVLGSGATARSACAALARLGGRRVVFAVRDDVRARTAAVAEALGLSHEARPIAELTSYAGAFDVLIATLPTGTTLDLPEDARGAPGARAVLLDAAYGGWPTPLARWAGAGGARVLPGTTMLLHQACEQVRLMTGRAAPVEAMRAALGRATGLS